MDWRLEDFEFQLLKDPCEPTVTALHLEKVVVSDRWNVFDTFVTVTSIIDVILTFTMDAAGNVGALAAARALRIVRVAKIIRGLEGKLPWFQPGQPVGVRSKARPIGPVRCCEISSKPPCHDLHPAPYLVLPGLGFGFLALNLFFFGAFESRNHFFKRPSFGLT